MNCTAKETKNPLSEGLPPFRGWDYARIGDYHRDVNPNWSYTPTYLCKMRHVRCVLDKTLKKGMRILDAGCGEGVLVEEYVAKGYDFTGLDLNYESRHVTRGSVLALPFDSGVFDIVLLLDVFEHVQYSEQSLLLKEIQRVLKPGGLFVVSIPNLAHLNSRLAFCFKGRLDRSDHETNHPGERPMEENCELLTDAGFAISWVTGITLTVPLIYRRVICRNPARFRWLHDVLEVFAVPRYSLLNLFLCRKAVRTGNG